MARVGSNFLKALAAIIVGNAIYFLAISPLLPVQLRHQPFQIDLGLILDFALCLVVYALINQAARLKRRS